MTEQQDKRPLVVGNWKMNGTGAALEQLEALATRLAESSAVGSSEVVICPPATLLSRASDAASQTGIATGGQDCHWEATGAHTGDVSADMLMDAGARWVILGHSERRTDHNETDDQVAAKARAAIAAGLTPIICVGESEAQRERGEAEAIVDTQLAGSIPAEAAEGLVVAYEPVWAIGTGKTAQPGDIAAMHGHIRKALRQRFGAKADAARLLYGGSVKAANAAEILRTADVDGALVGGASLVADDFLAIIVAA